MTSKFKEMSQKQTILSSCDEEDENRPSAAERTSDMKSELDSIKEENDRLRSENAVLRAENERQIHEIENLKSELVFIHQDTIKFDNPDILISPVKQLPKTMMRIDSLKKPEHHQRNVTNVRTHKNSIDEQMIKSMVMFSAQDQQQPANKMKEICAIGYKAPQVGQQFQPIEKHVKVNVRYKGNTSSSNVSTNMSIQRKQDKMLTLIKASEQQNNAKMSKFYLTPSQRLLQSQQVPRQGQEDLTFGSLAGNSSLIGPGNQIVRQVSCLSSNNNNNNGSNNANNNENCNTPGGQGQGSLGNQLSSLYIQQQGVSSMEGLGEVTIGDTLGISSDELNGKNQNIQEQQMVADPRTQEEIQFSQLFENVQNYGSLGDLLFEDFMVIGPNLQELEQVIKETHSDSTASSGCNQNSPNITAVNNSGNALFSGIKGANTEYVKGNVHPHILFSKPGYVNPLTCSKRQSVASFALPKGIEYYRFRSYDDLKKLPQRFKDIILFDLCEQREEGVNDSVFVINLKGEEKPRVTSTLAASNPSQNMYAYCCRKNDIYVQEGENGEFTIFMFPTVYCFLTYFPFLNYFLQLLLEVINKIKTVRLVASAFSGAIDNELKNVDFSSVLNQLNNDNELSLSLRTLQMQEALADHYVQGVFTLYDGACISETNSSHKRQKSPTSPASHTLGMKVPPIEELGFVEASEAAYLVLSNLPFEDFTMILTLVMLEKKIIFLSQNITLLTFTVQTFQTLFKPLQYPHPVIFCLSDDLLYLLDAPVPILIGLNMSAKHCQATYGFNPECYYVDLDKNTIISSNANELNAIQNQVVTFRPFRQNIKDLYITISGPITSRQFGSVIKKVFKKAVEEKKLVYKPTQAQQENLLAMLKLIKQYIMSSIVKRIPVQPHFKEDDSTQLEMAQVQAPILANNPDSNFLAKLVETQIFSYYLQQVYF